MIAGVLFDDAIVLEGCKQYAMAGKGKVPNLKLLSPFSCLHSSAN
jgi:hypothetical protein